jgi:hypothetical protein
MKEVWAKSMIFKLFTAICMWDGVESGVSLGHHHIWAPIESSGHGFLGTFSLTTGPDHEVGDLPPSSETNRLTHEAEFFLRSQ